MPSKLDVTAEQVSRLAIRIADLERQLSIVIPGRGQLPSQIRLARTTYDTDGNYPLKSTKPTVYPIVYVDGTYAQTVGATPASFLDRSATRQDVGYAITGDYLVQGTLVSVYRSNGRSWIIPSTTDTTSSPPNSSNETAIVEILDPNAAITACNDVEDSATTCVYSGAIATLDQSLSSFCSTDNPWFQGTESVWVLESSQCEPIGYLKVGEFYNAMKLGRVTINSDTRDIYAVNHNVIGTYFHSGINSQTFSATDGTVTLDLADTTHGGLPGVAANSAADTVEIRKSGIYLADFRFAITSSTLSGTSSFLLTLDIEESDTGGPWVNIDRVQVTVPESNYRTTVSLMSHQGWNNNTDIRIRGSITGLSGDGVTLQGTITVHRSYKST